LLAAECEQLDKAFFEIGLAASEFDVEVSYEIFQIEQCLPPIFDRHFFAVMRTAPIFAIAALVIAALDHFTIDRYRHGEIAPGTQIDFFCDGVPDMMGAKTRQFQDVHNSPREDFEYPLPTLLMVPHKAPISKRLPV
jgi:hypothetical protein